MNKLKGIGVVALAVLVLVSIYVQYSHEKTMDVVVNSVVVQQNVSGSDGAVNTSYSYLVATNKGVFRICPDGLFASPDFGKLQYGYTYTIHTRGISYPLLGIYPYIITIRER